MTAPAGVWPVAGKQFQHYAEQKRTGNVDAKRR
jgi:hypothetical protein